MGLASPTCVMVCCICVALCVQVCICLSVYLSSCVLATASQDGSVRLWGPRSHLLSRKDSTSTGGEKIFYLPRHKKRDVLTGRLEAVLLQLTHLSQDARKV